MNRETIEKTAKEYAKDKYGGENAKQYAIAQIHAGRDGFIDGAQWRINSVWHDAETDIPRENEPIIGITDKRWCYMGLCGEAAKGICPEMTKWAYVSDLMPDRKEGGR